MAPTKSTTTRMKSQVTQRDTWRVCIGSNKWKRALIGQFPKDHVAYWKPSSTSRHFLSANMKNSHSSAVQLLSHSHREESRGGVRIHSYTHIHTYSTTDSLQQIWESLRAVHFTGVEIRLEALVFPFRNFDFWVCCHGVSEIKVIAVFVLRVVLSDRHCSVSV